MKIVAMIFHTLGNLEHNQAVQIFCSKLVSVVDLFNGKYTDVKAAIIVGL